MTTFLSNTALATVADQVASAGNHLPQTSFTQDASGERICRAIALRQVLEGIYDAYKRQLPPQSLDGGDVELIDRMRSQLDDYVTHERTPNSAKP